MDSLPGELWSTLSEDERKVAGAAWVLFQMKDAPAPPEDVASQEPPLSDDENTIDLNDSRPESRASSRSHTAPWPERTPSDGDSAETDMMEGRRPPVSS